MDGSDGSFVGFNGVVRRAEEARLYKVSLGTVDTRLKVKTYNVKYPDFQNFQ